MKTYYVSKCPIRTFENFLSKKECDEWIKIAPDFLSSYDFLNRTIDILDLTIINRVKNFLEKKLNCKLECYHAQIQLWPVNSDSQLHIHTENSRIHGDYNSLIYLNDDFDGGEFRTEYFHIKPKSGMLTFFNGKEVYHGVNKVKRKNRYTLIFWWKNTKFL